MAPPPEFLGNQRSRRAHKADAENQQGKIQVGANAPAASAFGPSHPISMTSLVINECCARLVRISGQPKASMARNSALQAFFRSCFWLRGIMARPLC